METINRPKYFSAPAFSPEQGRAGLANALPLSPFFVLSLLYINDKSATKHVFLADLSDILIPARWPGTKV